MKSFKPIKDSLCLLQQKQHYSQCLELVGSRNVIERDLQGQTCLFYNQTKINSSYYYEYIPCIPLFTDTILTKGGSFWNALAGPTTIMACTSMCRRNHLYQVSFRRLENCRRSLRHSISPHIPTVRLTVC